MLQPVPLNPISITRSQILSGDNPGDLITEGLANVDDFLPHDYDPEIPIPKIQSEYPARPDEEYEEM